MGHDGGNETGVRSRENGYERPLSCITFEQRPG